MLDGGRASDERLPIMNEPDSDAAADGDKINGQGEAGPESLSRTLADFARTALAAVPLKSTTRMHHLMLTLAIRVWNECVAEARGVRQDVLETIKKDLEKVPDAGRAAFSAMAEQLYARKRAHFTTDLRYVGQWDMLPTKTGFTLRCEPLA